MIELSQRIRRLKPSPTLALAAKAKALAASGRDIISLSVGEPDWDTFPMIKAAAIKALEAGETKYTPAAGIPELRTAIVERTQAELGLAYESSEVTVSAGGKFVIFSALQSLLDPGDEVIIPAPFWVSYPAMVELAGGVPVIVSSEESSGFKMTGAQLAQAITAKTKLLILNSPSNPTGAVYSRAELQALAEVLKDHPRVAVLSDDIYNRLIFTGDKLAPHILQIAPTLRDRTLMVNGAAKTYAMTGWRVGWALGPKAWVDAMTNYQSQSVSCATSFAQRAMVTGLREAQVAVEESLVSLRQRRDHIFQELRRLSGFHVKNPDGAFYIWPDIREVLNGKTSSEWAAALLEAEGVAVVPGVEFGQEGFVRMSYVLAPERISEAVTRIQRFLARPLP